MVITGVSRISIAITGTKALDLSVPKDFFQPASGMENVYGAGGNAADIHWSDSGILTYGNFVGIDLVGSAPIVDAFGDELAFSKIKLLYIKNRGTLATLLVGGGASAWQGWLVGVGDIVKVPAGGRLLIEAPLVGYDIGVGEDTLRLAHAADNASPITYDIYVLGIHV